MTVRELISELLRSGVDMDAEVMVSTPLECNRGAPGVGTLILPTIQIETGVFPEASIEELRGKSWAKVCGTDAWRQFVSNHS